MYHTERPDNNIIYGRFEGLYTFIKCNRSKNK
jgi:hypothetical protein